MKKQDYIGAYLDGYFSDKKKKGMVYYSMLDNAIRDAEKKWQLSKKIKND